MLSLMELGGASTSPEKPKWPLNWQGETAVIAATGPSLSESQVNAVRRARKYHAQTINLIAVNDAGLARRAPLSFPDADVLYAADWQWWNYYRPNFAGIKVSAKAPEHQVDDLIQVEVETSAGNALPSTNEKLVSGGHSGYQALQIALNAGVNRVILLGFDCGAIGGKKTSIENREPEFVKGSPFASWVEHYNAIPGAYKGREILNASADSAITAFPKISIEEILS